jgi:hypothetical protein
VVGEMKKVRLGDRRKCDICGKYRLAAYINRFLEEYLCREC